ncbi:GNAT family N-acetyltransferase [Euzebya pacifica]|uniref:bifunctional acetate--CoA ligase family protein/GNAT family N-acetyltransferase n=1 Tax=Euzebya pacifica TaxID=1608957 RepID=UPI0030F767A7
MSVPDPVDYTGDIVLTDGQTVRVRPIRPDDFEAMTAMWQRLSPETIRLRFFAPQQLSDAQIRYLTDVDGHDRFALVAEVRDRIIAVARFDRLPEAPDSAEFAVTVEDAEQGRGLGTALLRQLLQPARDRGITQFHGEILKLNRSMMAVMKAAGFEPAFKDYGDVVTATFTTTPTEALLEKAGELDRRAARKALEAVFSPAAVAVIGASRDPGSIGGVVLSSLLHGGYSGPVYPVNPHTPHVQSVAAYPTLEACPTVPDTVFVCVPAPLVESVVDQAGELGVRAAVLIGTGFSESGDQGAAMEAEVLRIARRHGIRLIGPNCMGVLNAAEDIRLNGTFAPSLPPAGRVGVSSQSGTLGMAILDASDRLGLGLSTFASIGNKSDISSNDLLQYWEADDATDVIVLYLESFGNPRTFARIARRIGRRKPVVVVKADRRGSDDAIVQAMFDQTGVVRVPTLDQMFAVTSLLASQPLPSGHRVGIVSNGVGPAILAADACEANGLEVAAPDPDVVQRLAAELPVLGDPSNPLVLRGDATPADMAAAVRLLGTSGAVDALLVIDAPPLRRGQSVLAEELAEASAEVTVPMITVLMSTDQTPTALRRAGLPTVPFPEGAAEALAHVADHAHWRRQPLGNVVTFDDADIDTATGIVVDALASTDDVWLPAGQANALLRAHAIPCAEHRIVADGAAAAAAQEELGGPVVVKPAAPVEKTELGVVRLGLSRPGQIADAVAAMERDLRRRGREDALAEGWLVQQMIPDGVETTIAIVSDPTFGPTLQLGLGGTLAELLADRTVKVLPLTDLDVDDMLQRMRGFPLLTGYRGSSPVDVGALRTVLLRLGAMVEAHPEIVELELNPVFVRRHGTSVVDARVHLRTPGLSRR